MKKSLILTSALLVMVSTCITSCSTREMTPSTPASRSVMEFANVLSSRNNEKKLKNMHDARMSAFLGTNDYFLDTFLGNGGESFASELDYVLADEISRESANPYTPFEMLGIKPLAAPKRITTFATELELDVPIHFLSDTPVETELFDSPEPLQIFDTPDPLQIFAQADLYSTDTPDEQPAFPSFDL